MIKGLLKNVKQQIFKNEVEFLLVDKKEKFPAKKYAMMKRNKLVHREDVVDRVETIEVREEITILKDLQYVKHFKKAPTVIRYKGQHLRDTVEAYLIEVSSKRSKKVFKYIITRY